MTLAWTQLPNTIKYNLYYSTSPGVNTATALKISPVFSPYVHSIQQGVNAMYYVVSAVDYQGTESKPSIEVAASLADPAPANLTATISNFPKEVTLAWGAITNAVKYNVYYATAPGVNIATAQKVSPTYSPYIHSVPKGTNTLYYKVTAIDYLGNETLPSAEVVANLADIMPGSLAAATSNFPKSATLTWNPVANAVKYNLFYSTTPGVNVATATKISPAYSPHMQNIAKGTNQVYYVVTAVDYKNVESLPSNEANATLADIAPLNLAATVANFPKTVTLNWTPIQNAVKYNLYYSAAAGVNPAIATKITPVYPPYAYNVPQGVNQLYFIVTAVDTLGNETLASNEVSAAIANVAPANLTGVARDFPKSVNLTWNPIANAVNYTVYYSTTPGITTATPTKITPAFPPYTHSVPQNVNQIYFAVTATDYNGIESALSTEISVNMQNIAPIGFTATPSDFPRSATLTWTKVANAVDYTLYYSTTPGVNIATASKITPVFSPYVHMIPPGANTYYYVITATDYLGNESVPSLEVSATLANVAPLNFVATVTDFPREVSLVWQPVTNAIHYNIYYSTTPGVNIATAPRISPAFSPYVHAIPLGQYNFYYVVTATDYLGNESQPSAEVSATLANATPTNISVGNRNKAVTLTWSGVQNASSYNIYYSFTPDQATALKTTIPGAYSPYTTNIIFTDPIAHANVYFTITAVDYLGRESNASAVSPANPAFIDWIDWTVDATKSHLTEATGMYTALGTIKNNGVLGPLNTACTINPLAAITLLPAAYTAPDTGVRYNYGVFTGSVLKFNNIPVSSCLRAGETGYYQIFTNEYAADVSDYTISSISAEADAAVIAEPALTIANLPTVCNAYNVAANSYDAITVTNNGAVQANNVIVTLVMNSTLVPAPLTGSIKGIYSTYINTAPTPTLPNIIPAGTGVATIYPTHGAPGANDIPNCFVSFYK